MRVYAEASAVLSWLLSEPLSRAVSARLATAEKVLASDLTILECERALVRGVAADRFTEADAAERRALLARTTRRWDILHMEPGDFERAGRYFPVEPVRSLDALHLAIALSVRSGLPDLEVLTLDRRVRENAHALGLVVTPDL